MLLDLLMWWYGSGWADAWRRIGRSIDKTKKSFSIGLLLSNLFAPWKQIVTLPGKSIDEKFRAMIDNLVSRTIGFFVRLLTLLAALVMIILSGVSSLTVALVWPLVPIALIYFVGRLILG